MPHSILGQVRIERHEVRRAYLVDLHVTQSSGHTRHQLPVLCGRLRLQLAVCILGEPAFYQVVQLHGCIQRNAAVHFLFKSICLTLQFLFQLLPGQARRGSEGSVYHHLTALPVVSVGNPDAVGACAVLLHPLYNLCHLSPLLCGYGLCAFCPWRRAHLAAIRPTARAICTNWAACQPAGWGVLLLSISESTDFPARLFTRNSAYSSSIFNPSASRPSISR